jgi:diguanylate cyclase (GGDEF)-like protein
MVAALASKEFEVLTASSAEAAVTIFGQREIDIVLTDQTMTGMTGVQLMQWVRDHSPRTVRLVMTGLARVEDAVDAINRGQVQRYIFKPWRASELLQILRAAAKTYLLERSHEQLLEELRGLNVGLEERVRERTRQLEEANRQLQQKNSMLEKLALTDPLTRMPNRRAMDRLVRSEQRRRARYPAALAIGMIDADHFKDVNTRHLLCGGDQVLVALAQVLTDAVRAVDTVGRIGGEEFMVVAPETNLEGATILAERIRSAVEQAEIRYQDHVVPLTVSVGFAVAEAGLQASYDQFKYLAAKALAEAKAVGRNCCSVHSLGESSESREPELV